VYTQKRSTYVRQISDQIWTRLLPDKPREIDVSAWRRQGGKWIVFDDQSRILDLAAKFAPYIDSGEIESAKYWNGDPSAINVYSLDRNRAKTRMILKNLGARYVLVWEYDYAMGRNLRSPLTFVYSWFSKFRTILQSRGLSGSMRLLQEALKQAQGR
jgi:hypothetical protein